MATRPPDAVEVLVHVAAPSTTAADAAYRRLAHAYLSFRPGARTRPDGGDAAAADETQPASGPPGAAPAAAEPALGLESQDLSFQSAADNRSSPRWPSAARAPGPVPPSPCPGSNAPSQASFCAPASHVSDSYPLPDSGVLRASPTRILQRFLGDAGAASDLSASPPVPDSQPESSVNIPSSIPIPDLGQRQPAETPWRPNAAQVIPVTPLLPRPPARKRKAPLPEPDEPVFDITHVSSSDASHHAPPTPSLSRAESEPLPAPKRPRPAADTPLARSTSESGPPRRPDAALEHVASSCEIRPPSPPVGSAHVAPADLVSDTLAKLARDLSSRYRPAVRRPTQPLERGYWLLDCAAWPPQTRLDTWVFLSNYLGSGLAGWGVWCRRDAAPERRWLRLYCWACVAKHTYLLLYLASARRVKDTGARWLGADGDVVLEVAPCERRP